MPIAAKESHPSYLSGDSCAKQTLQVWLSANTRHYFERRSHSARICSQQADDRQSIARTASYCRPCGTVTGTSCRASRCSRPTTRSVVHQGGTGCRVRIPWRAPEDADMSAGEQMSYVALHSYWVSCMESNVPTELTDPRTIERVASLLRSQGASRVAASLPAPQLKPEAMRRPPTAGTQHAASRARPFGQQWRDAR